MGGVLNLDMLYKIQNSHFILDRKLSVTVNKDLRNNPHLDCFGPIHEIYCRANYFGMVEDSANLWSTNFGKVSLHSSTILKDGRIHRNFQMGSCSKTCHATKWINPKFVSYQNG